MDIRRCALRLTGLVGMVPWTSGAQQPQSIPIRQLEPIVARVAEPFSTSNPRVLSDGRLFVNDVAGHRLLLFDSTLAHVSVIFDTSGATLRRYPAKTNALLPFAGDSSVFCDGASSALLVLDPGGKIARIMPNPLGTRCPQYPTAQFDLPGRLIYQGSPLEGPVPDSIKKVGAAPLGARGGGPGPRPDSAPLLRVESGSPGKDWLAFLKISVLGSEPFTTPDGFTLPRDVVNPFPVVDAWTMTSDGVIAIVRGRDYHIDWIAPDGTRSSSPKIPYHWTRLSDSAKVAIVDSVGSYQNAHPSGPWQAIYNGKSWSGFFPSGVVPPDSLPDYAPPFTAANVGRTLLADLDGNIWILLRPDKTITSNPGPVYDVVNRNGVIVDRVQIPGGTTIVAIGGDVAYLSSRTGAGTPPTTSLARARIR